MRVGSHVYPSQSPQSIEHKIEKLKFCSSRNKQRIYFTCRQVLTIQKFLYDK